MLPHARAAATSSLHEIAHEAGADDDDVVAEADVGQLDGVGGAGQRLGQHGLEPRRPPRRQYSAFDRDVLGEAAAGHPDADPVARRQGAAPPAPAPRRCR